MDGKKARLKEVMEFLGVMPYSFAKSCGIASSNLSRMLRDEQPITENTLRKIYRAHPQINLQWLRTGEGEMLSPNPNNTEINSGNQNSGNSRGNLNQTTNSDASIHEFVQGLLAQAKLTEKAMNQIDKSMENDKVKFNNLLSEISAQRKLTERLVTIIENQTKK